MRLLAAACVLACALWAQAWQTNGIIIPPSHPRLWWNEARLDQARAWLRSNPFTPGACSGSANAGCVDIALKHAIASSNSCQVAIDWMNSRSCPGARCSATASGSDFARQDGETMMLIYDWCHDALTTADASTVMSAAIPEPTVNTTVVSASSQYAGSITITPASMSGISTGTKLIFNPDDTKDKVEQVVVSAVTASTFTATFKGAAHSAGSAIVNAQTVTPSSMAGIYLWQAITVDRDTSWVVAVTGKTFTAGFRNPHAAGAPVTGPSMVSAFIKNWNGWMAGVNAQSYGGPLARTVQNNYYWGQFRNDWNFAITSYGDNGTGPGSPPHTFLADAETRWKRFLASVPEQSAGGIAVEGPDYGVSVSSYPLIPLQTAALHGRDLVGENPFYKQLVYGMIYATTPRPTWIKYKSAYAYAMFPFSDDSYTNGGVGGVLAARSYYQTFMNWASNYFSSSNVGKYARLWYNKVTAHSGTVKPDRYVLAVDSSPAAAPSFDGLPLDFYASGQKYLYGRTAWDDKSTAFQWQLGSGAERFGGEIGDHGHQDFGNFNIWRGGRWLTRETSGYSLSWSLAGYGLRLFGSGKSHPGTSLAHNVVMFGTPLFTDDMSPMPSVSKGNGQVRRLESQGDYVYADVDLTNQYLWNSVNSGSDRGAVVHVERELVYIRSLEATVIVDRVTAGDVTKGIDAGTPAANQVNTFLIHFEEKPVLEDAAHLNSTNGDQVLRMTTLVPSNPARRVIDESDCPGCSKYGQFRVEVDTSGAAQRYFVHVLQGRDVREANVEASVVDSDPSDPRQGSFTVTLSKGQGSDTVLVFQKGRTSSGGSIVVGGRSNRVAAVGGNRLTPGVANVAYTDDGPVWNAPRSPARR